MNDRKLTEEKLAKYAEAMRMRYGAPVRIRIARKGHPSLYPRGTWFDNRIGEILEPAGIDPDAAPLRFVMANGNVIPFGCVEVIEKDLIRLGSYYVQFKLQSPYYVKPEAGENMWQLSLGFVTITRMSKAQ